MRMRRGGGWLHVLGLTAVITATLFAISPSPAFAAGAVQPDTKASFPSASSTVIASIGFIDSTQIGYFWSKARGDSVTQTISGPNKIGSAVLRLDVVSNSLTTGNRVNWRLLINGRVVGKFVVPSGFTGSLHESDVFRPVTGPAYTVKIEVTNEVPSGVGSITLAYAGLADHLITVKSP